MMQLEASGVIAGYSAEPVLHQVSAVLCQGEFVGLIGPNGCGKSTLLRCMSRILRVRHGSVTLDGREIIEWSQRDVARRMAFVPQQEPALFEFTVRDLVLMGRHPHLERWRGETANDYQVVQQALADADILHLADRAVTHLSGGEHRRVLLARALAQQTPLLLLDEPTAHLDVAHQVEMLSLVHRQTREQGQGALAALHDLNQAAEFCDRLILMREGRIVAEGVPADVLTADNLRAAYDANARIGSNPVTGRPMLLTVQPLRQANAAKCPRRVHVICGGGTGAMVLGPLYQAGFQITAGVLNRLDSDETTCRALGIATAVEAPFSPIGSEARAACAELIADAEIIIITEVPLGRGNLCNLELALDAQANGASVVLLGDADFAKRDYAEGAGVELLNRLAAGGARRFEGLDEWMAASARVY